MSHYILYTLYTCCMHAIYTLYYILYTHYTIYIHCYTYVHSIYTQPGFKVLKVDNDELSGLTVGDAEAILNDKYESDKASINLLVVPPKTA